MSIDPRNSDGQCTSKPPGKAQEKLNKYMANMSYGYRCVCFVRWTLDFKDNDGIFEAKVMTFSEY